MTGIESVADRAARNPIQMTTFIPRPMMAVETNNGHKQYDPQFAGAAYQMGGDRQSGAGVARAALSLSLILHELGTNALKYGAFSTSEGRVAFEWTIGGSEPMLRAEWREVGGPVVREPSRKGFGTRLIGMGLIGSGGASLSYLEDVFVATFEAPLRLAQSQSR